MSEPTTSTDTTAAAAATAAGAPSKRGARQKHDVAYHTAKAAEQFKKLTDSVREIEKMQKKLNTSVRRFDESYLSKIGLAAKRESERRAAKRMRRSATSANCTFMKLTRITTPEMRVFMGFEPNDTTAMVAQRSIQIKFYDYVRKNGLQDPNNKKRIRLDDTLKPIFPEGTKETTTTDFNRYSWKHLQTSKNAGVVTAATAA